MRFAGLAAFILFAVAANAAGPSNRDNDASCDVAVFPAATLLVPYFEVALGTEPGSSQTTIFTVTNVTNVPQAVNVTLWTNFDHPVLSFPIYLTGYDVQSVNLFDVLQNGRIGPDRGGANHSPVGEFSESENPLLDEASCRDLPSMLPSAVVQQLKNAFTRGMIPGCNTAGTPHTNAVGYATLDVVGACTSKNPADPAYFDDVILFDNVLTGDYLQVDGYEDFAQASAMVHIRAVPEGGRAAIRKHDPAYRVDFPRTFYGRFQHAATPTLDGRQPLPSVWAARWVSGGGNGFETSYKIWREGPGTTACTKYTDYGVKVLDMVRFDDEENPETHYDNILFPSPPTIIYLPFTSLTNIDNDWIFPGTTTGSVSGWLYLNADVSASDGRASQSWVVTSMRAEDRFSADVDAAALGNGCSAEIPMTEARYGTGPPIAPAPNARRR